MINHTANLQAGYQATYQTERDWFTSEIAKLKNLSTILPSLQVAVEKLQVKNTFLQMAFYAIYRQFVIDAHRIAVDEKNSKEKCLSSFFETVHHHLSEESRQELPPNYVIETKASLKDALQKTTKLRHNLFAHTNEKAVASGNAQYLDMVEVRDCYEAIESCFHKITFENSVIFSSVNVIMDLAKIENLLLNYEKAHQ